MSLSPVALAPCLMGRLVRVAITAALVSGILVVECIPAAVAAPEIPGTPIEILASCDNVISRALRANRQEIRPVDLIRLRDFGPGARSRMVSPFSISPDGGRAALVLRQADPVHNANCVGIVIVQLDGSGLARAVDLAVEIGPSAFGHAYTRSLHARQPQGFAPYLVPSWSPDGRWVAFLKRRNGKAELWRARADGSQSEALTEFTSDVSSFRWRDDRSLEVSVAEASGEQLAIDAEGLRGWRYDQRIVPRFGARPQAAHVNAPLKPIVFDEFTIDAETKAVASTRGAFTAESGDARAAARAARDNIVAMSPDGSVARVIAGDLAAGGVDNTLALTRPNGQVVKCESGDCRGVIGVWWGTDGRVLFYMRREGWALSEWAMYAWDGQSHPVRQFSTSDLIAGCQAWFRRLICLRESSASPRHLIALDPITGSTELLFDPNPETANWRFGRIERMHWRTATGEQVYGDLVLPPTYRPGKRYPLIVVGYESLGFLRGGVGDEYPIQPFAARGYAVFVYNFPYLPAIDGSSVESIIATWRQERTTHSAIVAGVQLLIDRGIVDAERVGMTGFSIGAVNTTWALINSNLFSAAAISQCCTGPTSMFVIEGQGRAERHRAAGWPGRLEAAPDHWMPAALELNADRLDIPLLIQTSDDEYLFSLPAVAALQERNRPVDMYIFPDEGHLKLQPAHGLAVYNRNIDWLNFWLRGVESGLTGDAEQYARWRAMRENQCKRLGKEPNAPWYCRR